MKKLSSYLQSMCAVPSLDCPYLLCQHLGLKYQRYDKQGGCQHAYCGVGQRYAPSLPCQCGIPVLDGMFDRVEALPCHQHRQEGGRVEKHRPARVQEVGEQQVKHETADVLVSLFTTAESVGCVILGGERKLGSSLCSPNLTSSANLILPPLKYCS